MESARERRRAVGVEGTGEGGAEGGEGERREGRRALWAKSRTGGDRGRESWREGGRKGGREGGRGEGGKGKVCCVRRMAERFDA
jgi:hypothetical protein